MKYYSTRDVSRSHPFTLKDAASLGLAPDGGLFMPEFIPQADLETVRRLASISYAELAGYLASLFSRTTSRRNRFPQWSGRPMTSTVRSGPLSWV